MIEIFPSEHVELDSKDREIVELLKQNARISQEEIARITGLSRPTVQKRWKSLEKKGVILRYTIIADERKLGKEITAFIIIGLDKRITRCNPFIETLDDLKEELEVLEFHHIAGEDDLLLKLKTRNIETLEHNLAKISEIGGVIRTRTMISLRSVEY